MLITGLHAGAGAAVSVWAAAHAEAGAAPLMAGLPWLAGSAGALALGSVGHWLARLALAADPAWLRWDGSAWQLRTDRLLPLQRVVVSMDLGAWMLLRLVPADRSPPLWRATSARAVGTAWHGLRVALQAHAGDPQRPADSAVDRTGHRP